MTMNDDEFEREVERIRRERGEFPNVTVLNVRTGEILTMAREDAKRDLAFGSAIETVPEDAEQAKVWLAKLRARVGDEMHAKGAWEPSEHLGRGKSNMDVFREWEEWCRENGFRALPVEDVNVVVRFLLQRYRDGVIEAYIGHYANVIAAFHSCTKHPVLASGKITREPMGKAARSAFNRAIVFGRRNLAIDDGKITHDHEEVASRAMRMFPDGDVPAHYHEIAA